MNLMLLLFFENHVSGKIQAKFINDDLNYIEPSKYYCTLSIVYVNTVYI